MGVNAVPIASTTVIPTLNKNEYCMLVTTPGNTNDSDVRMKLKGIDGGPHKRWSLWSNSMQNLQLKILVYVVLVSFTITELVLD